MLPLRVRIMTEPLLAGLNEGNCNRGSVEAQDNRKKVNMVRIYFILLYLL